MAKLVFSSDQLPAELDDAMRFALWQELYVGTICHFDVKRLADRPFAMHYEFVQFGEAAVASCAGTITQFTRTRRHAANDPNDNFYLHFNGARPWSASEPSTEASVRPGACVFLGSPPEVGRAEHHLGSYWRGVGVSRRRLLERVPNVEDYRGVEIDPSSEVLRHLKRYMAMLLGPDDVGNHPALNGHIESTLIDLVGLLFDGLRDTADLARMRGLRAARLQEVLSEIRSGFADPAFEPATVADKLRCSTNYIQKLLYETGTNFTERVLELRLQKARNMLTDRRNDRLRVSDIALACGFNEVSYFNRCFRRRFGDTPTQWRGLHGHRQG